MKDNKLKIEKFDDVYIKSKNLSGIVYEIKDKEVIVNTLKEGLIKTQINDLKKIQSMEKSICRNYWNEL